MDESKPKKVKNIGGRKRINNQKNLKNKNRIFNRENEKMDFNTITNYNSRNSLGNFEVIAN